MSGFLIFSSHINCTQYMDGKCLHQAAPRAWFGPAACILRHNSDIRVKSCALQIANPRPKAPPKAP